MGKLVCENCGGPLKILDSKSDSSGVMERYECENCGQQGNMMISLPMDKREMNGVKEVERDEW